MGNTGQSFFKRVDDVYPRRTAVIQGDRHLTWQQVYTRCQVAAARLAAMGIELH